MSQSLPMDVRLLRYFVVVADEGSIRGAATALRLAQPSLSRAIRDLERECGVPLLHRTGRGVTLTDAGRVLLERARHVLRDLDACGQAMRELRGLESGTVEVAATQGVDADPLSGLMGSFRKVHPGISFHCVPVIDAAEALQAVRTGSVEVGIVPGEYPTDGLRWHRVGSLELLVAFPPGTGPPGGFPCSYDDLEGVPFVAAGEDTAPGRLLARVRERGVRVPVTAAAPHPISFVWLVAQGVGAAFLSGALAREVRLAGAVVGSLSPKAEYPVFLVHRDAPLTPAAEAFVRMAAGAGPADRRRGRKA